MIPSLIGGKFSMPEPQMVLKQVIAERDEMMKSWSIAWLVRNLGRYPLHILSVRLPHGEFYSEERRFEPAMDLNGGEELEFRTSVRCDKPSGLVAENAFVIFHATLLNEPWRIFVRLRVLVNSDGKLETATEFITTQKVGFSGVPEGFNG